MARPDDPDRIAASVESLERAFARLGQVIKANVRDFAAGLHEELRPAGWHVLGIALRGDSGGEPTTVGEIVAATGMDKSVVSRQLRSLKDWGLVSLRRSPEDARVVIVEPTPLARERVARVRAEQRERYTRALAGWSVEDIEKLEELLDRLSASATMPGQADPASSGASADAAGAAAGAASVPR